MAANSSAQSKHQKIDAGCGRIVARLQGSYVVFPELSAMYPMKLLSPRMVEDGVAIVYVMSYGGGLVGGDALRLSVDVGPGTKLLLLSQGSTKVFKARPGMKASTRFRASTVFPSLQGRTTQSMDVSISSDSGLFLLPDPVTCFRSASYSQVQTFRVEKSASLVLLDWVTSGRMSLGEQWAFSRYYSVNEVFVDGQRVIRDVMLLEDSLQASANAAGGSLNTLTQPRSLKDRLAPHSCYAMLILFGPLVRGTITELTARYDEITVFKTASPASLLWSHSPICDGTGCIVRVAGVETEDVKKWLRNGLSTLTDVVGQDAYRKAFV